MTTKDTSFLDVTSEILFRLIYLINILSKILIAFVHVNESLDVWLDSPWTVHGRVALTTVSENATKRAATRDGKRSSVKRCRSACVGHAPLSASSRRSKAKVFSALQPKPLPCICKDVGTIRYPVQGQFYRAALGLLCLTHSVESLLCCAMFPHEVVLLPDSLTRKKRIVAIICQLNLK